METEVTPGGTGRVRCPKCRAVVFFRSVGGPHQATCSECRSTIGFDVVHDGRRWTVRRVRSLLPSPPSGLNA
jgi:hypothetical protein